MVGNVTFIFFGGLIRSLLWWGMLVKMMVGVGVLLLVGSLCWHCGGFAEAATAADFGMREAAINRTAWEANAAELPAEFFVQRKRDVAGRDVLVFSNEASVREAAGLQRLSGFDQDPEVPQQHQCPYSAVVSPRERIHPLHHVWASRHDSECVFHVSFWSIVC